METLLIIAALGAVAASGIVVAATMARARRPELRLKREDDLEMDGEETLMRSIAPPQASPIDRDAPVLEQEPVRQIEASPRPQPADREDR